MEKITKWQVPEGGGAPLLTMPNVPHDCHGRPPRTLMERKEWDAMRKACYAEHEDICEVCGRKCGSKRGDQRMRQAHECYTIDYTKKTCTFERLYCICSVCHNFIHSGRAITMYKNHTPLWTKQSMLDLAEHGFRLVYEWNKRHPDEPKLKVFQTIEEWMEEPSLTTELQELVGQYEIEFYHVPRTDRKSDWGKWKLVYDGVEYYSTYASQADWEAAMVSKTEQRQVENKQLFDGDIFEELRRNINGKC